MLIYGVTIISSDADMIREDDSGSNGVFESLTKLFTDREERKRYAVEQAKGLFELAVAFESDDPEEECDYDGHTLATILFKAENEEDVVVQGSEFHYTIEFFRQEVV